MEFLKKHMLDEHSHPMDWFNALIPLTPSDNIEDAAAANVKGDRRTKFAMSNWAAYSNAKALLANAGEDGHIYAEKYKALTPFDINKVIGVYIIDGLSPSPQLGWKMQPQSKQPSHGCDFAATCIGSGYQQLIWSFRCFFVCQDPLVTPPSREKCPNFKVDELFRWLRFVMKEAWLLGEHVLLDE